MKPLRGVDTTRPEREDPHGVEPTRSTRSRKDLRRAASEVGLDPSDLQIEPFSHSTNAIKCLRVLECYIHKDAPSPGKQ